VKAGNTCSYFYILLTVHPNIKIALFFTNLMHKVFILIHLLHSSTCFEHYCVHLQEHNCINTASGIVTLFSDCSVHRLREDSSNLCTEQSPKESDDKRCCTNQFDLVKMSIRVLETCRGI